ncbi:MAG: hypothetical protein JKY37_31845 [Nannocystaceae bacterium]|nr:hypothetical protein [Nannocystaceae bacterium]
MGRSHIVAVAHTDTDASATFAVFALGSDPLSAKGRVSVPAIENPQWPKHYRAIAAHGGGGTWLRAESGARGAVVVRADETGAAKTRVLVGEGPAALHAVGHWGVVGQGGKVGLIDFSESAPSMKTLHERADMAGKAYDLFVQHGDWLIAIDDEVSPVYADTFTVGASKLKHAEAWTMPGLINGTYYAVAFAPTGPRSGTLFALAQYGIMDGSGHDLAALAVVDGKLAVKPDVLLNGSVSTDPPVREEHVSRRTGKPEKLAWGTAYSDWTDLAIAPDGRLLLSAVGRGLLVLPADFSPTTAAVQVDVGGDCLDLISDRGRVLVLVGAADSELVELNPQSLEAKQRYALHGHYDRLL